MSIVRKTDWVEFTVAIVVLVASPLFAFLSALIFRALWNITMAPQYGDGPSLQSWFGIALLVGLMTSHLRPQKPKDKEDTFYRRIAAMVGDYLGRGLVLLFAAVCCWALGWS